MFTARDPTISARFKSAEIAGHSSRDVSFKFTFDFKFLHLVWGHPGLTSSIKERRGPTSRKIRLHPDRVNTKFQSLSAIFPFQFVVQSTLPLQLAPSETHLLHAVTVSQQHIEPLSHSSMLVPVLKGFERVRAYRCAAKKWTVAKQQKWKFKVHREIFSWLSANIARMSKLFSWIGQIDTKYPRPNNEPISPPDDSLTASAATAKRLSRHHHVSLVPVTASNVKHAYLGQRRDVMMEEMRDDNATDIDDTQQESERLKMQVHSIRQ